MALRSVLDIEVNSGAFDTFLQKFKQYQQDAANLPQLHGGRRGGGRDQNMAESLTFGERWKALTKSVADDWDRMKETSANVMRHVRDITSRILHVSSLMGLVGGLATGFGFMGMDALGRAASGMRRQALGLGTETGTMRSFNLNMGRFVNTEAFLSGTSEAMRDPSKRAALFGLGIRPRAGADTGEVAQQALRAIYEEVQNTDESMLGAKLTARKWDQFGLTTADVTRLKHTSRQEFEAQMAHMRQDNRGLNLTDATLRKWQDFTTALERAGKKIETVFIEKLTPLTPALEKLSTAFTDVLSSFLGRKDLSEWIEKFAKGIENFAKWIGGDDFKKDLEDFGQKVKELARSLGDAIDWILSWLPSKHGVEHGRDDAKPDNALAQAGGHWSGPGNAFWVNPDGSYFDPKTGKTMTRPGDASGRDLVPGTEQGTWENKRLTSADAPKVPVSKWGNLENWMGGGNMKFAHDYFISQGWTEDQTTGILANLRAESGAGLNPAAENASGHQGIAQWDQTRRARFKAMFGHDPKDGSINEQLAFVQWELTHTHKGVGDELHQARTAAEATETVTRKYEVPGSGAALDREVANRQALAAGLQQHASAAPTVHVAIRNQTGGNAIVAANQGATAAIG